MQTLSFDLCYTIGNHLGLVFPTDEDLITQDYDGLLLSSSKNNRPGQLKLLLEAKCPEATRMAAERGHTDCLQLLIDAGCPIIQVPHTGQHIMAMTGA